VSMKARRKPQHFGHFASQEIATSCSELATDNRLVAFQIAVNWGLSCGDFVSADDRLNVTGGPHRQRRTQAGCTPCAALSFGPGTY
jgi:hypothetical protein